MSLWLVNPPARKPGEMSRPAPELVATASEPPLYRPKLLSPWLDATEEVEQASRSPTLRLSLMTSSIPKLGKRVWPTLGLPPYDPPLQSSHLGCVYHFVAGRNAWRSTWTESYPDKEAFSLDLDEVVRKVERSRVQGSKFTLYELPALVLAAESMSLVLSDPRGGRAFAHWRDNSPPPATLFAAAAWASRHDNCQCWTCHAKPPISTPPFRIYQSRPRVGREPLYWRESSARLSIGRIRSIVRRLDPGMPGTGKSP